jgi:NADH-quinone oxidoreductase subunit C
MADDLNMLGDSLRAVLGDKVVSLENNLGELTLVVDAVDIRGVLTLLRDDARFRFEQLIDLCGMDYSTYGSDVTEGGVFLAADSDAKSAFSERFAVVYHLLSIQFNHRLRVKAFAKDDAMPVLDSAIEVWSSANWFEREAFDLYGIIFIGHPDLRRILTDYGFVGNPFRKDFPLSGHVEMRYDPAQQRVVYQPVSIEPREVTPRIVREETYGCN